jgi:hypothetical protein
MHEKQITLQKLNNHALFHIWECISEHISNVGSSLYTRMFEAYLDNIDKHVSRNMIQFC